MGKKLSAQAGSTECAAAETRYRTGEDLSERQAGHYRREEDAARRLLRLLTCASGSRQVDQWAQRYCLHQ